MIETFIFIIGTVIGSFLNVCIYRMPREKSIVKPRSYCPGCRKHIAWFDNIPILSYILLKGKCRNCKKSISPRYIIVEILTGALLVLSYKVWGLSPLFVIYSTLFASLVVVTFIDFEFQIIPDEISYGGMALGLFISLIYPRLHGTLIWHRGLLDSFLGLLAGGAMIYGIGILGKLIFKKDAMGGGDVKLMAMIGAFLGWKYVIIIFFMAPFFGSIVGLIMKYKYKVEIIPYGPYLSLATIVTAIYGNDILRYLFKYRYM